MSIKLIATDLDGTLMSTDHMTITDFTLQTLKEAHSKGVKIAIATGRPLALTDNVTQQIPFADYVIYANGAGVYDRLSGKTICSDVIFNKTAVDVINCFLQEEVFFEIYINGKSHYQSDRMKYFKNNTDMPQEFIEQVADSMDAHDDLIEYLGGRSIEKITLYSVEDWQRDGFTAIMEKFDLTTAVSFVGCLEGTSPTANKGTAVESLSKSLGLTAGEVMCFGDAGNDIPMLEYADFSFAMGNATDDCKAAAKYTALSNAEDGLAKAVREFVLNNH
ncbi:MAG: Cof-type HAD-IIB family hydrolase [Clostridium sp.]|nr:Cof-type HAD-IIB family hydrolase [Clostridium sp.]